MYPVFEALRKEIEMDDPHTLNKYLGCFHHFLETTVNGEKMMTIQFDMADYFKSACEIFVSENRETLKPASTRSPPTDRKHLRIIAWPDANLNGDFMSKKSTDGFFMPKKSWARGKGLPPVLGLSQAGIAGDAHCGGRDRNPRALLQARAHPPPDPPPSHAWGSSGLRGEGGQRGVHHRRDE